MTLLEAFEFYWWFMVAGTASGMLFSVLYHWIWGN